MRLADLSGLATQLNGVAERRRNGLQSFPETFSVPKRYRKHMMIVADLETGNADAVEDAIIGAWELQFAR